MKQLTTILMTLISILIFSTSLALGRTKVVVQQNMDFEKVFAGESTKYVIKENIDLNGTTLTIGNDCTLVFRGGSLGNGTVVGNHTKVKARNYEIFRRGITRYRAYKEVGISEKKPPILKKEYRHCIIIEGTWNNTKCGSHWTGLLNDSNEDVMLAVRNYITLHKKNVIISFPTINALGYENTIIPSNRVVDYNNSIISYPDNLDIWADDSIVIPDDAIACPLEAGYGLITMQSNTIVKNLTLDGKSYMRQKEPLRLGVSCLLNISNASNVKFNNICLKNTLGPAMVTLARAKDITFINCRFFNIGEHVMYGHQYLGFCHFEGCHFDTWDSERLSVYRNGIDYLYKHAPLSVSRNVAYDTLYKFDLSFTNCTFNNPKRINSQGRTLGGFLTGDFPVVLKLNNCKFIGAMPIINPGGKEITEETGMAYQLIASGCDGAPNPYASKSNYNLIAEYFDCINLPFRVVYAKRYERCKLYFDLYEDAIENVTPSFESEFTEPLLIKDCEFIDNGSNVKIHHPLCHRPVIFENCRFLSTVDRSNIMDFITVKKAALQKLEFYACDIDLPMFRLVGGKNKITTYNIKNCNIKTIIEQ